MKRSLLASFLLGSLVLTGCTSYSATPAASGAPEPAASAWPAIPFDCSAQAAEPDTPESLPEGAARISLCNEAGHGFDLVTPPDALVVGTGAVVTVFNAQEKPNLAATSCTADFGPAYRLVVEYPDGAVVQVRGEMYGCRFIGERFGAQEVLDAFGERLRRQRQTMPVGGVADPLDGASCEAPDPGSWLPATMEATVAGYGCSGAGTQPRPITGADWETIRADWDDRAEQRQRTQAELDACTEPAMAVLTGVTAAGERLALQEQCGLYELWQPGADEAWVWLPGPAASTIIEAAG